MYIRQLREMWSDAPRDAGKRLKAPSPVEKCLATIVVVARLASLSNVKFLLLENSRSRAYFMDWYVVCWLLILLLILAFCERGNVFALLAAGYEAADILVYRVYFFLVKSREKKWQRERLRRTLALAILNLAELVVAYGILYFHAGRVGASSAGPSSVLETPVSALYFSLTTMATVGYGDLVPLDDPTRILVMTEMFSGLLMLVFLLPTLLGVFSDELHIGHGNGSTSVDRMN